MPLTAEESAAKQAEREHMRVQMETIKSFLSAEVVKLESKIVEKLSGQPATSTGRASTSWTAVAGLCLGIIGPFSLLYYLGVKDATVAARLDALATSNARLEAGQSSGRDERLRDVARLDERLGKMDTELRATATRMTRQEVLQEMRRPMSVPALPEPEADVIFMLPTSGADMQSTPEEGMTR